MTFYLFPRVLGHVDPLDQPRALLDNGLCSTSLGLDFFQPATRPAPLSLLSIGLSNLPGPTLFGLSSTRPATSLFGLSSTRPATSLFGPSSTRPATSLFGPSSTRPATSLFGLSSTRPTTSSTSATARASQLATDDVQPATHILLVTLHAASLGTVLCSFVSLPQPCVFFLCCSLLSFPIVIFFFIQTHWRGSIVVFLSCTLHTCTFVLSYFIFIVHNTTFIDNAFLFTHARSSTSDWHRHHSSQLVSFSLSIASLPFSSWQLYSSLLINRTFPPPLVSHVATLVTPTLYGDRCSTTLSQ